LLCDDLKIEGRNQKLCSVQHTANCVGYTHRIGGDINGDDILDIQMETLFTDLIFGCPNVIY
jgi:hypothetical protein